MENANYFLKSLGLESYMGHDPIPRVDMDNFELETKIKTEENSKSNDSMKDICEKHDVITEEVRQMTADIEADDFFSSLELLSSSKMSSNMLGLNFSNKISPGILTRSRFHEGLKVPNKIVSHVKISGLFGREYKKKKRKTVTTKRKGRTKRKRKGRKQSSKKGEKNKKVALDEKKTTNSKLDDNILGINSRIEKDDWGLFNNLNSRNEGDDKTFENKQTVPNELPKLPRKSIPDLFPINPIPDAMSEGKDEEVDNFLDEDYEDNYLEEMEEYNYAPPRSHTGGKWKPGSLTVRTSPTLWHSQNWDNYLDDRHHDDDRRNRALTPGDSPTDSLGKSSVSSFGRTRSFAPPATHTGGKWKPTTPPASYTGGKWKPITPPATHTGGKWKPSDSVHRSKKHDQDSFSTEERSDSEKGMEPPPSYTGGKWKPNSQALWKTEKSPTDAPVFGKVTGKWKTTSDKNLVKTSTLDELTKSQSTSGKCLKASGGTIQYYCFPCNRRLSSKKMYKKHIQSELHFKRFLQENELEFDSRSIKFFRGYFHQPSQRERSHGKRVIKKPEILRNAEVDNFKKKKVPPLIRITGQRVIKKEITFCDVCEMKIPSYQLGKHLVSYYHSRRIQLNDPKQRKQILDNIHAIVKQAPYQCGICKFYCNSHSVFKKHWSLSVHKQIEQMKTHKFWCALCNFECYTALSMELHLDSNSHRDVILTVNKSIPIIIRHKLTINCDICLKEFRFHREVNLHKKYYHEMNRNQNNKNICTVCHKDCKSVKSLQRHILLGHKGNTAVPYFCTLCDEYFKTPEESKAHRGSLPHRERKLFSEQKDPMILSRNCSFCGNIAENLCQLKVHLLEKHYEFLPRCIKCGKVFALSQEVSQHVKSNECDFIEKKPQPPDPELFRCDKCMFSTKTKSELMLHIAVHIEDQVADKKITCPLCNSRYNQTALRIHLRSHLEENTFLCSICLKAFVRKDRYLKHIKFRHKIKHIIEPLSGSRYGIYESKSDKKLTLKLKKSKDTKRMDKLEIRKRLLKKIKDKLRRIKDQMKAHNETIANTQNDEERKKEEEKSKEKLEKLKIEMKKIKEQIEKSRAEIEKIKITMEKFSDGMEKSENQMEVNEDKMEKSDKNLVKNKEKVKKNNDPTEKTKDKLESSQDKMEKDVKDKSKSDIVATRSKIDKSKKKRPKDDVGEKTNCKKVKVNKEKTTEGTEKKNKYEMRKTTKEDMDEKNKTKTGQQDVEEKPTSEETEESPSDTTAPERKLCGDRACRFIPKDEEELETHVKFHIGRRLFRCTECFYKAETYSLIKRHFITHGNERFFPCNLCSFKARLKPHLKRHMKLHTGVKPYKCPHCSYTCNILENLRKHVICTKIHPGKRMYECKFCEFSTNDSKDFKLHLSKKHKNEEYSSDVNEEAGIYNKQTEGEGETTTVLIPKKRQKKPATVIDSPVVQARKEQLLQKFIPIAPKPPPLINCHDLKDNTTNTKVTTARQLRSYPSPVEKDKNSKKDPKVTQNVDLEVGVGFFNLIPKEAPIRVEPLPNCNTPTTNVRILNENDPPSKGMELYLEKYHV